MILPENDFYKWLVNRRRTLQHTYEQSLRGDDLKIVEKCYIELREFLLGYEKDLEKVSVMVLEDRKTLEEPCNNPTKKPMGRPKKVVIND